jgi:hypothetical protein
MKFKVAVLLKLGLYVFLITLFFSISIRDLYVDVINPDGINWHTRTQAFTKALRERRFDETFQTYHPGITLMWVSGPILDLFLAPKIVNDSPDGLKASFLNRDYYAKMSLVVFATILFAITLILLWKMIGLKYAFFYALIFILEPFVIGMRKLYHLDYLMTSLLFLSFLFLIYYNYKTQKWILVLLSGFLFSLSFLTKSSAIMFLPAVPFIFLLGNGKLLKKLVCFILFLLSSLLFTCIFFPPVWNSPVKSIPKYYKQILVGVTDIGIEGKKEIGFSGKNENVTLDETLSNKDLNFYLSSLFMRLTPASCILLTISLSLFIYLILKGKILAIWNTIRNKKISGTFAYPVDSWLSFWSVGLSIAFLIALTLSVKKTDRYEILVFPFLFTTIAYFLNKLKIYVAIPLVLVYAIFAIYELSLIHPYYLAYSNPYLGGIERRLRALDGAPFGIGSYAAFEIIKNDMIRNNYSGYYTVSGSKSIKAISVGGKFSRSPSCVTDYNVVFAFDDKPTYMCVQDYVLINTVKISGFDYWYIYKRLNQLHQSNYE